MHLHCTFFTLYGFEKARNVLLFPKYTCKILVLLNAQLEYHILKPLIHEHSVGHIKMKMKQKKIKNEKKITIKTGGLLISSFA